MHSKIKDYLKSIQIRIASSSQFLRMVRVSIFYFTVTFLLFVFLSIIFGLPEYKTAVMVGGWEANEMHWNIEPWVFYVYVSLNVGFITHIFFLFIMFLFGSKKPSIKNIITVIATVFAFIIVAARLIYPVVSCDKIYRDIKNKDDRYQDYCVIGDVSVFSTTTPPFYYPDWNRTYSQVFAVLSLYGMMIILVKIK